MKEKCKKYLSLKIILFYNVLETVDSIHRNCTAVLGDNPYNLKMLKALTAWITTETVKAEQILKFAFFEIHLHLTGRCIFLSVLNRRFAVIGTGVVGTALAVLLEKAGLRCVGVHTRTTASYENFCRYLKSPHLELSVLAREADLLFITTLDGEIERVAEKLAKLSAHKPAQVWIHCSGSLQSASMRKNPELTVSYLSVHPLQAFADVDSALQLMAGVHFGIEGSNQRSEQLGRELVQILGGIPHRIKPEQKTLYHAGAVVASNYLVSLAYLGVKLFEMAGISRQEALESLLPLMQGAYQNVDRVGLHCALTGPIARGDVEVIEKHLQEMPEELGKTYKALGRLALELGKERKKLQGLSYSPESLERLKNLLKED